MSRTAPRPLTVLDYRQLPEGPPFYQLIEGDLCMSPSPNFFHQHILVNLVYLIRAYLEEHPIGEVCLAPSDVELTEFNVYQPDLYFVARDRKGIITEQGVEGAPNLVVEILSASTARLDKGVKRAVYARTGVEELWLVDPDKKQVQVFRLAESADTPAGAYGTRQKFSTPLLPGLEIAVAKIFKR